VHAWLLVTATVVTLGSAAAFALTRPSGYVATAQVVLGPELAGGAALRPEMASEREIATSGAVTDRAANRLGLSAEQAAEGLTVSAVIESSVLNIRYSAASADAASAGATAFAQSYVDYRNSNSGRTRIARVVTWPDLVVRTGPNLALILGIALVAGLTLGVGMAWLWDRLSDRLRDAEELTDNSGLPVLVEIPRWRSPGWVVRDGAGQEAVGYVAARISSAVSHRRDDISIMVTSPRSGAGTTTIAFNTALAFAAQGRDVVLVDADLHHPQLHEVANVARAPGLLEVLSSECDLESAIRSTHWPHLSVLSVGGSPHTRHRSLQQDRLGLVLGQLGKRAVVVIDAPPVLESAAAVALADLVKVVLVVGDLRSGRRQDVEHAARLLEGMHPVLAGWVANHPDRTARPPREGLAPELTSVDPPTSTKGDRSERAAS
jgi:Mrp family chromosome partitioning ATPase/capsular polysaccharide biosynthesis protein